MNNSSRIKGRTENMDIFFAWWIFSSFVVYYDIMKCQLIAFFKHLRRAAQ
jgi:hypothetical protein